MEKIADNKTEALALRAMAIEHLGSLHGQEQIDFYKLIPDSFMRQHDRIEHIIDADTGAELLDMLEYNTGESITKSDLLWNIDNYKRDIEMGYNPTYSVYEEDERGRNCRVQKTVTQEMLDGWLKCMIDCAFGVTYCYW